MNLAPRLGVRVPSRSTHKYQDRRPTRDDPGLDPSKSGQPETVKWLTTQLVHTAKWKQSESSLVHAVSWSSQGTLVHTVKRKLVTAASHKTEGRMAAQAAETERSCVSTSHHQIWPARAGPATMDMTHDPKTEQ